MPIDSFFQNLVRQTIDFFDGGPQVNDLPARKLEQYPNKEDIEFGRAMGADYGTGSEAFARGEIASTFRGGDFLPVTTDVAVDPDQRQMRTKAQMKPELNTALADTIMAGQMASKRSAVASLGFDPRFMALSGPGARERLGVGGATDAAKPYNMWASADFPEVVVHESMHRGLNILRDAGIIDKDLDRKLPSDEMVVRYLMMTEMADPEKGGGSAADRQRERARDIFEKLLGSTEATDALEELNKRAQKFYAKRNPGGPN